MTEKQITHKSDTLFCILIITLAGGGMDAYSYLFRDKVFANAQTGNMLLLGVNLANGNLMFALKYLWPILAFMSGIILADIIRHILNSNGKIGLLYWRQIIVMLEALILLSVAFIHTNFIANALISFACGMQVQTFRKIGSNVISTTMCIGNLRNGTHYLVNFIYSGNKKFLRKSAVYFIIILTFIFGAIIESWCIGLFGIYSIIMTSLLLFLAFFVMFEKS